MSCCIINGEVRLWGNGEEVSGGTKISPASGYFCLESEVAPVEFKNQPPCFAIRISVRHTKN